MPKKPYPARTDEHPDYYEVDPPSVNMAFECPFCEGNGGEEDADEDGRYWSTCSSCSGNGGWDTMTPVWNAIKSCTKKVAKLKKEIKKLSENKPKYWEEDSRVDQHYIKNNIKYLEVLWNNVALYKESCKKVQKPS